MGASGPLAGIRVVEFAGIGPAPFAALLLADLGAEVVRIDRPASTTAFALDAGSHRGRANIAVDLKHPEGHAVVLRLVQDADVVIEGLRPGVMERLGLGPEDLMASNPGLIYGRMTGWGQHGPYAQRAGHDITYAAISGALHLCGTREKPMMPVNVLADFGGGTLYLVAGVLAALIARGRDGKGQVVDAAMVDGAASLVTMFYAMYGLGRWRDERGVNLLDGGYPFYDTYQCADGKWLAIGPLEPQFYAELLSGLGVSFEHGQYDPAGFEEQRATFTAVFLTRTRDEWATHFEGTDACVAPVLSLAEAPRNAHMAARGSFVEVGGLTVPAPAPRFSAGNDGSLIPDSGAGGDTAAYLIGRGFTPDEVAALLDSGAIYQADGAR